MSACGPVDTSALGPLEAVIVIDVSISTIDPSGVDVDSDGTTGERRPNMLGSSDPGDSLLAAQVSAARSLVAGVGNTSKRIAIVGYSDASTRSAGSSLEGDPALLDPTFERILSAGSAGGSQFSSGMKRALDTLAHAQVPGSVPPKRVALFLADSPTPRLRRGTRPSQADPRLQEEAERAIAASVTFHTFGLDEAATTPPPHALSRIAEATGGTFTAVEDLAALRCTLLSALLR